MGAFWIYGQCRIDDLFCAILHYVQLYYDYSTPFLEHTMRRNHPLQFDPVGPHCGVLDKGSCLMLGLALALLLALVNRICRVPVWMSSDLFEPGTGFFETPLNVDRRSAWASRDAHT